MRLIDLVRELLSLNDDNLAERVIKDRDVQWCLSELYDFLEAGAVPVVRCRECRFSMKPCAEEMRDKQVYCQLYRQLKALVGYCDHGARMYWEEMKHAE